MELTSGTLLTLVSLLTAGCVIGTVWVWPRLARRHWAALLGRLGTIVGTQIATLATLALVANNYFGFYGSWDDLLGTGASLPVTVQDRFGPVGRTPGSASSTTAAVQVLGRQPGPGPQGDVPTLSGAVERVRIGGARSGLVSDGYVYLPPQYFQPAFAHRRLPVAVALTGYPGDARNLVTRLNYPQMELDALQAGRMQPVVLVLMRPTVAPPRDTECQNVPHGPQSETYFTRDVPQAITAAYRVATGPRSWGIIGDSTGGYCALKLAMRHPEDYGAAVSLSGYYKAAHDPTTGDLFGHSARLRQENDLMWRLAHLPPPTVSLLVTSSRHGESDYKATEQFIAAAHPPLMVSSITLPSGGHNFGTWKREIPAALPWLSDHLQQS